MKKQELADMVIDYKPREFHLSKQGMAEAVVAFQERGSAFVISKEASIKSGVGDLERQSMEQKVEELALLRLKDVQEGAYKQAYDLGLEEGKTAALNEARAGFQQRIDSMDAFLKSLETLASEIVKQNEAAIVKLVFQVAKRIAYREIQLDSAIIVSLLKEVIGQIETDERIIVHMAPRDKEFLESVRETVGKEFVGKAQIEVAEKMTPGGCTVETRYGTTDATLEERVNHVWESLESRLPRLNTEGS